MKYTLILFDFDGTLADTYPWFTHVMNSVAEKYNFKKIDPSEEELLRGYSVLEISKYLGIPRWKIPFITKYMRSLMGKSITTINLFSGVDILLKELSDQGLSLGIVTSNSLDNVSKILGSKNLSLIQYLECGVSVFGKIPKVKNILKKSKIDYSKTILIGDEVRDIEAAKKAQCVSGAVTWGYNTTERLQEMKPHKLFFTVQEIADFIISANQE